MPIAILFPGQGSQTPEMREPVARLRPDLLELAVRVVGDDPFARVDDGTRFAQPAIFCASLAGWSELTPEPAALAGHSLGELTALTAAGALAEEDGLRLVALRARLMSQAAPGAMIAALRADRAVVEAVAARHDVVIANDNAPGELVLSGAAEAARAAAAELRAAGARTLELNVSGAFHSPLMAPAVEPFAAALAATDVREPRIPVWSCVTAAPFRDPDEVRALLAQALTAPVRWRELVQDLMASGIDDFTETGPGLVLTRLIKRIVGGLARA